MREQRGQWDHWCAKRATGQISSCHSFHGSPTSVLRSAWLFHFRCVFPSSHSSARCGACFRGITFGYAWRFLRVPPLKDVCNDLVRIGVLRRCVHPVAIAARTTLAGQCGPQASVLFPSEHESDGERRFAPACVPVRLFRKLFWSAVSNRGSETTTEFPSDPTAACSQILRRASTMVTSCRLCYLLCTSSSDSLPPISPPSA
jgi:hypothetical protein